MQVGPLGGGEEATAKSVISFSFQLARAGEVPFKLELSSVPVPKSGWNCRNFSSFSSVPYSKISEK